STANWATAICRRPPPIRCKRRDINIRPPTRGNAMVKATSAAIVLVGSFLLAAELEYRPFAITIVDEETGRGVPLVELQTVNNIRYYTDSNGVVAFDEPGLMNQTVFFHIKSHGYEFPKDGFGYRGKALAIAQGGKAELKIKRINI